MNIETMTIGEARQIATLFANPTAAPNDSHWEVGQAYFIRTVTHHLVGRLVKVTTQELVLTEASWIADDGRFANALAEGEFNEVEPFPQDAQVIVGRGSLIDAVRYKHTLNLSQK